MIETATFAAGCFWGVEELFRELPGVVRTSVGYTGGKRPNPTYEQVCSSATGHAEAVEIVFEPALVSYETLIKIFFENHHPTTRNQQGPDVGSQYRSVIFTHSPAQERAARTAVAALEASGRWGQPIVTQIVPAVPFYRAEEYHQEYYAKRGGGNCRT